MENESEFLDKFMKIQAKELGIPKEGMDMLFANMSESILPELIKRIEARSKLKGGKISISEFSEILAEHAAEVTGEYKTPEELLGSFKDMMGEDIGENKQALKSLEDEIKYGPKNN